MRLLLSLILAVATCWAGDPLLDNVPPQLIQAEPGEYRLPTDAVTPVKYDIALDPVLKVKDDSKSFRFTGRSDIALEVKKTTKTIVLHSKDLVIDVAKSKLTYKDVNTTVRTIDVGTITFNKTTEFAKIELKSDIPLDKNKDFKLHLEYSGTLNDDLRGFYRSSYQNENGETRWLATTHFEPTSARKAFPCWDEPALKANFILKIKPPAGYHVISNTMNVTNKDADGYVQFAETPKMSTYLVAFVVSDFVSTENANKDVRVWSKPTSKAHQEFALKFGEKALKQLEDFIGYPYKEKDSITKMDQIAIPQFAAGAMENWGLVTYKESALLYNKNVDTTETKQSIATVIAHEFAHQWFGNRVTCNWWNSIWLNEGFATFFQYYITDLVRKETEDGVAEDWRLMEQFAVKALQASAFVADASVETRALTANENSSQSPEQISSLFDDIAYRKGGSILRMMQQILTEKIFQQGLQKYVKAKDLESVEPSDLFKVIEETQKSAIVKLPNNSLSTVMDSWVYKPGYPVVTATINDTYVTLTQERFFSNPDNTKLDNTKWYIPITYLAENSSSKETLWLTPDRDLVEKKEDLKIKDWVLFNKDQTGYYRVNYDDESWDRLVKYLNSDYYQNISAVSRAQLIDDASNLARAGYTSYNISLSVTSYLHRETDYIVWYAAARAIAYHDTALWGTEVYDKFVSYVARKAKNFIDKNNYEHRNGTHVERLAKVLALKLACKYRVSDNHVTYAKTELQKWLNNGSNIWQEVKDEILCAGLRDADKATVENVLKKYNTTQNNERAAILTGLGCNTNEENIKQLLERSIDKESTIKVDVFSAMTSVYSGNPGSTDILIKFIQQNITQIKEADKTGTGLAGILHKLATRIRNEVQFSSLSLLALEHLKEDQRIKTVFVALTNLNAIKPYQEQASAWIEKEATEVLEPTTTTTTKPDSASSITLTSILIIIPVLLTRYN